MSQGAGGNRGRTLPLQINATIGRNSSQPPVAKRSSGAGAVSAFLRRRLDAQGEEGPETGSVWLAEALANSDAACRDLASLPNDGHWQCQPVSAYRFGHSLGELLSLSMPSLIDGLAAPARLQSQQLLVADPATRTQKGYGRRFEPEWLSCSYPQSSRS